MRKGRQKKQQTPAGQTTATIDTNQTRIGGSSWYSGHTPEGYAPFQQFQNGFNRLIECKEKIEPNTTAERPKQKY